MRLCSKISAKRKRPVRCWGSFRVSPCVGYSKLKNVLNFEQDLWLQDLPRKRRTKMKKILKNRDVYSFDKINLKDFKLTWENYAYEKMIDIVSIKTLENWIKSVKKY